MVVVTARNILTRLRWSAAPLWLAAALITIAGCGGDPTGYVGTASNAALYVSWTRTDNELTGQLTQTRANDDGDGTVQTRRTSFTGTVNENAVSLRLDHGFGTSTTLTGTLNGDTLALDYPGKDGAVITIRLAEGNSEAFNARLAELRERTATAKHDADEQAARDQAVADEEVALDQARTDAANLASSVRGQIDALDRSAEDATASNPGLYDSDLQVIRSSLDTVNNSYQVLESTIENGYDTVCDDAALVADDVKALQRDIDTMRRDVNQNTDPSVLDDDISALRDQYQALTAADPGLLPAGAPTKANVDQAIRKARRKVRRAGGANFTAANKLLGQAQSLKAKADAACQAAGG
jgi:hypothetical protein